MALTDKEAAFAYRVTVFNGGTDAERARFKALSDEAARTEIAAYKENRLIAVNDELAFLNSKVTELTAEKSELENNV